MAALASRAAGGDERALRVLLERLGPGLLAAIRAVLGAGHPATEDLLQDSLIGFVRALPSFRGESRVETYAARIAMRTAIGWYRQARERGARDFDVERALRPDQLSADTPEESVLAAHRRAALRAILAELPEAQAEAIALRIVLDYSLDEISAATGAPKNTIRSRVRLARQALRARIESDPVLARKLGVLP